ncbi:hypothetical protein FRB90_000963 [Tulasnella sp. 427]|nr:hypothetical protein FRB90_000963 [Tulasnella sp. 427]
MLKRTKDVFLGLFKGQKPHHLQQDQGPTELVDDSNESLRSVPLVFGLGKSSADHSSRDYSASIEEKPLPDIPVITPVASLPLWDISSLRGSTSSRKTGAPKTPLDSVLSHNGEALTIASEQHGHRRSISSPFPQSGSQRDLSRLRPQSEDHKVNQRAPVDSVDRRGQRSFLPPSTLGNPSGTVAIDEFTGSQLSLVHSIPHVEKQSSVGSFASGQSSNLVRPLPTSLRKDSSDLQSIYSGLVSYSEDIPPMADEEVGDAKWVKFITLVEGQHGYYRPRRVTAIACGGFSDVWNCDARFSDGSHLVVAVKKLRAVNMPDNLGALEIAERLLKRLNKEIRIWMALRHPNIAPLIGFTFSGEVCVISPWFSNGNVAEYLQRNPGADRLRLIQQVASGVAYLHGRKPVVVHGDLKHDNVLIDRDGNPRIIDFGLSKAVEEEPGLAALKAHPELKDVLFSCWDIDSLARPGMAAVNLALHSPESA